MHKHHLTLCAFIVSATALAQDPIPAPEAAPSIAPLTLEQPAPIDPPIDVAPPTPDPAAPLDPAAPTAGTTVAMPAGTAIAGGENARTVKEFQGDEVGQVLRLLARQANINVVVSDQIQGTVEMRLIDVTPLEAMKIVASAKNLFMEEQNGVYFIKTAEEKGQEPTQPGAYTFSYAQAQNVLPLLISQLKSGIAPQFDTRTNTIFFQERISNLPNIDLFLQTVDTPTKQVMIEARLVEVNANPKQAYGINWGGVVGSSSNAQTIGYGGSQVTQNSSTTTTTSQSIPQLGQPAVTTGATDTLSAVTNSLGLGNFLLGGSGAGALSALAGQFAILSAPQLSLSLRLLNEDSDAEFLANPRVVTANNQKATIKIIRNQPVPQLNFNEQTATAVFGGFEDKEFGNTLIVTPSINKDDFISMLVQPEISNKVGDATFTFAGATVASPVIDTRSLESQVLIKSGDTLAIGGLMQDEVTKARTKVPVLGDIPGLGYLFQERVNSRTKRNLLIFVTPTIISQNYGTGLEDQVSGLHHSGEEFADPNGWRNNARGAVRVVPTSNRQLAADYPKPGTPIAPRKTSYRVSAAGREK